MQDPGGPPRRFFVALRPPEELAERIAVKVDRVTDGEEGLRTYSADDLHVTLCFLGELEPERLALLRAVLPEELRGTWAPELRFTDVGAFPDRAQPRVVWLGMEELGGHARLAALEARVRGAALAVGWRPPAAERQRPFLPHLTLARVARGAPVPHRALFDLGFATRWMPVEVTLFESRPDTPGERYRPLVAVPLVVGPG